MATYYWVGGTGTWNASNTTNWASSSGGTGGAGVPTSADNVIIDASSGTGTITCSFNSATCLDLTVTASQAIVLAGNLSFLYGSLTYPSGGSFVGNVSIVFAATTTGKTITTNGKSIAGTWNFQGVGGEWTLGSSLTMTTGFTLRAGTFNTANFNITAGSFSHVSSGVAVLNLGSSTLTVTSTDWNFGTPTNLTLNAGTSTIIFSGSSGTTFAGGGLTYYNLTFSNANANNVNFITGANTFNNLTFNMNTASNNVVSYTISANQIVNGIFTINGFSYTRRIAVKSASPGVRFTISAATVSMAYTDFSDILGAGTGSWTGTSIGDCGNNSGITFDTPKTVYWNLAGAAEWGATAWATTSGGTPAAANFPLAQDTAVFDNTGSVTGTISVNNRWNIGTVNLSARTSAMTLSIPNLPTVYGNWTNGSGLTLSGTGFITFSGKSTQTITSNGKTFTQNIDVASALVTFTLADAFTNSSSFSLTSGTLNLANNTLTTASWSSTTTNTKAIQFGTENITITGSGTAFNMNGTGFTYTGTPTVNISNNSATATTVTANAGFSETTALNFNFTTGTYSLTFSAAIVKNLNFTGFAGTINNSNRTIYGNLTVPASGVTWSGTSTQNFSATSGTQTITTNGATIDVPFTFNGAGGTREIAGDLTLGSTRALNVERGIFNTNNFNVTVGLFNSTYANTRTINMGSGTWTITGVGAVWNIQTITNLTFNPSASTIVLSNTSTTARTFHGGSLTYNNLTIGGTTGTSTLTFTGSNTFNTLSSTKTVAHTILFTSSTTNTFTNFNINGTAGNIVTIGSTLTASHTLAKAGGGTVTADYLSISYSTATPTLTWLATNSTDGGNNSGWNFGALILSQGNFFLLF